MNALENAKLKIVGHLAGKQAAGMSWQQTLDFACTMLGITQRHLEIDSARAVVHVSYTQFTRQHVLDVSFNDIVAAVNGVAMTLPAVPADADRPHVPTRRPLPTG